MKGTRTTPSQPVQSAPAQTTPKPDNKKLAQEHLTLAKENFSQGKYVEALKEATMAEYLDSSNAEISAFVETVRKRLLK